MAGWLLTFGCLCGVIFILISGFFASQFGWRAPFYLHAVVSVVFLYTVLCIWLGTVPAQPDKRPLDLLRFKPLAPVFAVAIIIQALVGIFLIQLALLVGHFSFGTPNAIALIFALIGTGLTAASYSYGLWFMQISPPIVEAYRFAIFPWARPLQS